MKKSDHPHPSRRAKAPEKPALPVGCVRTAKEVAEWFEKSVAGVDEWRNNGCPWTPGAYDIRAIALWVIARAKQRTGGTTESGSSVAAQAAEQDLRLKRARAEAREFRNTIEQGKYVLLADVQRDFNRIAIQARDLLQRVATELAPAFPADVRDDLRDLVANAINRCLTVLSEFEIGNEPSSEKDDSPE